MNFDNIFDAYYTQYRAEATTPSNTDDEYIIGMRLANEALNRWSNYDGTYWNVLFSTNLLDGSGTQTISTGVTTYNAPLNFKEAGGFVSLKRAGTTVDRYPIIQTHEVQFRGDDEKYCYFASGQTYYSTGTASQSGTTVTGVSTTFTAAMVGMQFIFSTGESATISGYTSATVLTVSVSQTISSSAYRIVKKSGHSLVINPSPASDLNGLSIDYTFYKKPTEYTDAESISEIPDPYFVVHRMLASRFRSSRNPYYSSAKADGENALRQMQTDNNSGTWADPWNQADNSGTSWGR